MKKVGIVIDSWKKSIFERHLKNNGYNFEFGAGVTHDTISLYVWTDNVPALGEVVKAAAAECAQTGKH